MLLVSAFALCGSLAAGLIGIEVVRRDDAQVLQLQHRQVQSAAAQLGRHALDSDAAATISQSTGLPGLVFEAEPTTNGRAQQTRILVAASRGSSPGTRRSRAARSSSSASFWRRAWLPCCCLPEQPFGICAEHGATFKQPKPGSRLQPKSTS